MSDPFCSVRIPKVSFRVYQSAVRFLRRKIGAEAPTPTELLHYELSNRDARMIADEYLEMHYSVTLRGAPRRNTSAPRSRPC